MNSRSGSAVGLLAGILGIVACASRPPMNAESVESSVAMVRAPNDSIAGEYLTIVGGCNDCHTAGWDESNGNLPASERLAGNPVGFRGPWGTSYAANLRGLAQRFTEDRWVQVLKTADDGDGKPPMPWMNTRQMADRDLRALYRYIRSLGPRGERMPRSVAPNVEPTTPYIWMVPRQPGQPGPTGQ
jgi:cytochrome c1